MALRAAAERFPEKVVIEKAPVIRHWVNSPLWDALTTLSGISFCILLALFRPFSLDVNVALILFAADRALGMLHSWSTTYLVVGSPMFASLRRENPDRYVRIPLAIFLFSLCLGIMIAKTVNISDTGEVDLGSALYYLPYIGLFWIGHFWHFGRQDFGVLSLYRTRALQFTDLDRQLDNRFAQVMMYVIQPIVYFATFTRMPFTVLFTWITGLQSGMQTLATFAVGAAAILFVVVVSVELRKANRSYGKLLYYGVMLFHPVFLYFASEGLFIYWHLAYLWSHWIIAISLSAKIAIGYDIKVKSRTTLKTIAKHFLIIGGVSAAILFIFAPFAGMSLLNLDFIEAREMLRTLSPDRFLFVGLYFGFGLGEQLVHYYCDRCLFRFKNRQVRALVAPHL